MRLDLWLYQSKGLQSRQKAAQLIKNGSVQVNGAVVTKAGFLVKDGDTVVVTDQLKYVGRGGYKLEWAVNRFGLDFSGKMVLDIGASTGGFTDCALSFGAAHVYAVDVGRHQLDTRLAQDPRVTNMEETDIRNLSCDACPVCDAVVTDVSFISVRKIIEHIRRFTCPQGFAVTLIKPQFELGHIRLKNGVVRSKAQHLSVLRDFIAEVSTQMYISAMDYSPVRGGGGNIEFLALLRHGTGCCDIDVKALVEQAHKNTEER